MSITALVKAWPLRACFWFGFAGLTGCKINDILGVPSPVQYVAYSGLNSQSTAEQAFLGARGAVWSAIGGTDQVSELSDLMTDELMPAFSGEYPSIDFRNSVYTSNFGEPGDGPIGNLLLARSDINLALAPMARYLPGDSASQVGEAYGMMGYSELVLAEDYCAGVPLSQATPGGGATYGASLSTDSLLHVAELHFDSALVYAHGNDTVEYMASVGLGRTLVDRDSLGQAASAVASVPTNFVYNMGGCIPTAAQCGYPNYEPMWWAAYFNPAYTECNYLNVSDFEGENGLGFRSAHDPRLVIDTTVMETCDFMYWSLPDSVAYYPEKFGRPATNYLSLATGIEARLIEAEAALSTGQTGTWLSDLNAMRGSCPDTATVNASCSYGTAQVPSQPYGLLPLTDPGTTASRVNLMFSERAFWLFGTGSRLGDLRRLIRQYGRGSETVFPTGAYALAQIPGISAFGLGLPTTYGTDVSITLPTAASGNTTQNTVYRGCLTSTQTA